MTKHRTDKPYHSITKQLSESLHYSMQIYVGKLAQSSIVALTMSWSTRSFECTLIFIILCKLHLAWFAGLELELQRVEQTSGPELIDADGLRIMKFNRTLAVLNGSMHITRDLGELFEVVVVFFYSS